VAFNAGVVEGAINGGRFRRLSRPSLRLAGYRDIGMDDAGGAIGVLNHFDGALATFLNIVGDHHGRAFLCEFQSRGAPDTGAAAGDQRNLALNESWHF
jgi:hypothetical protein